MNQIPRAWFVNKATLIFIFLSLGILHTPLLHAETEPSAAAIEEPTSVVIPAPITEQPSIEPKTLKQERPLYFYSPDGQGANGFHHPLTVAISGGFGAMYDREIDQFDMEHGWRVLGNTFLHPIKTIQDYGTKKFFYNEFLPHPGAGGNWVPNYNWHLIGGGFRTQMLIEYYRYHGYKYPKLAGWLTAYSYHLTNEMLQAVKFKKYSEDCLPDLFFFDWVGGLLFAYEPVSKFASEVLHLRDWSYQTQWVPARGMLLNNGQLYVMRVKVWGPLSIGATSGEQANTFNLVVTPYQDHQIGIGFGLKPKDIAVTPQGDSKPSSLSYNAGLYYSRHDNPVVVATYETRTKANKELEKSNPNDLFDTQEKIMINLYPGWFGWGNFKPGLTAAWTNQAFFVGIAMNNWPIGFATRLVKQ